MEWISYYNGREMVRVACPHCGKILNIGDNDHEIHVKVVLGSKKGNLYLSALWGDFKSRVEGFDLKEGDVVEMFCPHCEKSLKGDGLCKDCDAITTIFAFADGYSASCNRKGCKMHLRSSEAKISHEKLLRLRVEGWKGPYAPF